MRMAALTMLVCACIRLANHFIVYICIIFHKYSFYLNFFKECIGFIRVKALVSPHERHKILAVRKIYYVMSISGKHVHSLDSFTRNVKGKHLIATDPALLNTSATGYNDEELPLSVMPMLSCTISTSSLVADDCTGTIELIAVFKDLEGRRRFNKSEEYIHRYINESII